MNPDTYKYITSHSIDEQLSNWIEVQQSYLESHGVDSAMVAVANKKIHAVKLLQESSVLVKETGLDTTRLYHYEMPGRDITRLALVDPDFVEALNERTKLWSMTLCHYTRKDPQHSVMLLHVERSIRKDPQRSVIIENYYT